MCFFIDRDFSDHIPAIHRTHRRLFVTDGYSIENYLAAPKTFVDAVLDNLALHSMTPAERARLRRWYQSRVAHYCRAVQPLMAETLAWHQTGHTPCWQNISLNSLFDFHAGGWLRTEFKPRRARMEYLANITSRTPATATAHLSANNALATKPLHLTTRGKNLLEFVVALMRHVHQNANNFCAHQTGPAKPRMNFGAGQAIPHMANHSACPPELARFLQRWLPAP